MEELKIVNCRLCHSRKIIDFIDGFGQRRRYCKACRRSYLRGGRT